MSKNKLTKLASLITCAAMILALQIPPIAFAEGADSEGSDTQSTIVAPDLKRQNLANLYASGMVSAEDIELIADEESGTLLVSGGKSKMQTTTIVIDKLFDFGTSTVGRFSVSGIADIGKKITLAFFLDDSDEPFFTTQLASRTSAKSNGKPVEICQDVIPLAITGTHTLSIRVIECGSDPSFTLESIEFSQASIPVVNVQIDESLGTIAQMNASKRHTDTCYGSISIDVPENCTSVMTGSAFTPGITTYDMEYIRGRGNSTWTCAKKPYKFKLQKSKDLLDMGANKHWALMANAIDEALLRNAMTSRLGFATNMDYTPSMEPVEVIMNGSYLGCYYLSEVIRTGTNRVEVEDIPDDATDPDTISGGYLLSYGNWNLDADKLNFKTARTQAPFQIESPDVYSSQNRAHYDYIKNYVQETEDAIYNGIQADGSVSEKYADLMDVDAAAKYYWIEELSRNGDGYTSGSCYLYKHRNGKLCWGPLWDFDLAWGNGEGDDPMYDGFSHSGSLWNDQLFKYESFSKAAQSTWTEFKAALNDITKQGGVLDQMADRVRVAACYDREKWRGLASFESSLAENSGEEFIDPNEDPFAVFDENLAQLRDWVDGRTDWINGNLSQLSHEPTTINLMVGDDVWKTMVGFIGCKIGSLPTPEVEQGSYFAGWTYTYTQSFEEILAEMCMSEDQYREMLIEVEELTPEEADARINHLKEEGEEESDNADSVTYVKKGMVLKADIRDFSETPGVDEIYLPFETLYGITSTSGEAFLDLPYSLAPRDAAEMPVKIVSSDENVVSPRKNDARMMDINGPGDAVVTIVPFKGPSATIKVHIYTVEEYAERGGDGFSFPYLAENDFTMESGQSLMIPIEGFDEGSCNIHLPHFVSSNTDVVEVDQNGVLYANKPGFAVICAVTNDGDVAFANVMVTRSSSYIGTEDEVEEAILNSSSDEGPADAYFTPLCAKATTFGTTSYKLSWLAVDGAAKYKVYGNKCGSSYKYEYKGETAGTSVTMKGMKKGTYYKHMVVAVDSKGKVIAVSKAIHACTTGGKYTNYKYVKTAAKNSAVTLKKGKTFSLKAKAVKYSSSKTVKSHRGKRYLSSDKSIATVSSLGKITAKAKGTCYVYVYTQNGAYKRIKVTVK